MFSMIWRDKSQKAWDSKVLKLNRKFYLKIEESFQDVTNMSSKIFVIDSHSVAVQNPDRWTKNALMSLDK